jgi:HD-GYP domain-containing protein (c-di-GMP phosphodiesterase class II)
LEMITAQKASDAERGGAGKKFARYGTLAAGLVIFLGLYLTSLYSYLLFHSLAEIFSIVIAGCVFILAWNSRHRLQNAYLIVIGIAFLSIAFLDTMHTLAYKGMGVFVGYDANLPTQLWVGARYLQSLSFLIAPLALGKRVRARTTLAIYGLVTAILLLSIFAWHIFPTCYIEGTGLTPFKKASEYIISLIFLGSIALLLRNRNAFDKAVLRDLIGAIILMIGAELAFTIYVGVYDFPNLVGHLLKIASYYFVYRAIIETGIARPFDLLFREIKSREEALRETNEGLEVAIRQRTKELSESVESLREEVRVREEVEGNLMDSLRRMKALREIDMAITSSLDPRVTFDILVTKAMEQLGVDAACVLVFNPLNQTLDFTVGRGFRTPALQHTHLRLGQGFAGRAAKARKVIHVANLRDGENGFGQSQYFDKEDFVAYYAAPLMAKGIVQGVLEIFHRSPLAPEQDWMDFLETLLHAYDSTLEGWSLALELRDFETKGHTQRVTDMTMRLANAIGVPIDQLTHIRRGALLHDIGKVGIPDSILLKESSLTEDEWTIMRKHPAYAHEMLMQIDYLRPAIDIPYSHHEKWDGTGYPRGLEGEEIPFAARIFAVVDVYDALLSDRPYRPAWPHEKVLEYIREQAGSHFDPEVVKVFLSKIDEIVGATQGRTRKS